MALVCAVLSASGSKLRARCPLRTATNTFGATARITQDNCVSLPRNHVLGIPIKAIPVCAQSLIFPVRPSNHPQPERIGSSTLIRVRIWIWNLVIIAAVDPDDIICSPRIKIPSQITRSRSDTRSRVCSVLHVWRRNKNDLAYVDGSDSRTRACHGSASAKFSKKSLVCGWATTRPKRCVTGC
jgi:hypothetical protein